ncbi:HNH endonuclease family protein [Thermodesulfovibrio sp. 3907-1M]|uniref:HNH endonuclease family protein n=1 Tax=Thermodesulfovibrio autotrophicus TaxID=3118333 RepID=A0AAU8GZJ4_9BACT
MKIKRMLKRLNRLEVTTAYPFLLNVFREYEERIINKETLIEILKILENFIIRRFICNIPTNQLNKIFPPLYSQAKRMEGDLLSNIKTILQSKNYPKDAEFKAKLVNKKLYGSGDLQVKAKLILESIEENYAHKEQVLFDDLTIEHIMPQTLSEWWQKHLGEDWGITHELLLHTIGNLTLTAYNPELSNADFETKKQYLGNSHLEMNKYFNEITSWKKEDIEKRAQYLSEIAISIWPYFGDENFTQYNEDITGTRPKKLYILRKQFEVLSWRDVMEKTINCIIESDLEKFEEIIRQFPRFVGRNKNQFRQVRELINGAFMEVNLSAKDIYNFCIQMIETLGLTSEDWRVEFS